MVSGFPHAGRISATSCGVIVHRHAWIHRSGSRFGSAIAFALYWSRFFSAGSSQCSSSHRSYSSGGHAPASSGAHGQLLMTQWYWSKSVQSTRFSSTRRCRSPTRRTGCGSRDTVGRDAYAPCLSNRPSAPTPITGPRPGPDAAYPCALFRPSSTHRRVKSCSTSPHPRRRRWPAGVRPTMRACTSRNARTTSRCQATVGTNTGRSCVRTPNGPRARRRPSRTVRRGRRAGRG